METVLVVDDDQGVREAMKDLFSDAGYDVIEAQNGRLALDLLQAGVRPCAIVLDLMMPVMDGWDFRASQLQDPDIRDIPVLVISAAGLSAESIRTQFGDLPFLHKPADPEALVSTVKAICRD